MTKASSVNRVRRGFGFAVALSLALVTLGVTRHASAQVQPKPEPATTLPPPASVEYLQYGVSLHTLTLLESGGVCPEDATTPCIVGSGGGLGLRVGYRARGPFYLGAGYQLSRLNASNLLRLATLQRLSAEGRYYFYRGNRLTPYLMAGLGVALYGNEFTADAIGIAPSLAVGIEYEISESTVVALVPAYQPAVFRHFTDATGQQRADDLLGFGLVHWLAVQVVFEIRDPLSRW
jgi:hypothetical protein